MQWLFRIFDMLFVGCMLYTYVALPVSTQVKAGNPASLKFKSCTQGRQEWSGWSGFGQTSFSTKNKKKTLCSTTMGYCLSERSYDSQATILW